jgi:hypothetical protein
MVPAGGSSGGRPPWDAVPMCPLGGLGSFVLVLRVPNALWPLAGLLSPHDQTEDRLRDRLSFMRFVDPATHDAVRHAETICPHREPLRRTTAIATPVETAQRSRFGHPRAHG